MTLIDVFSNGTIQVAVATPPTGFVLPSGIGQFWRLRWDEQVPPDFVVRPSAFNKNGGTPATRVSEEGFFVPMDKACQTWFFGEVWRNCAPPEWVAEFDAAPLNRQADTMLAKKWLSRTHSTIAFHNHNHGSDVKRVYLFGGLNEDAEDMAQQMLDNAGALKLQVAPTYTNGRGEEFVPCAALKPTERPAWSVLKYQPWLLSCCTIQRSVEFVPPYHRVNPWDQLTRNDVVYDVPLTPLSMTGVITFNKTLLDPVDAGTKVPCPYHPSRPFGNPLKEWN